MGHKPSVNPILLPLRWVVSNVVWLSVDHHNLTLEWLSAIVLAWPTQCRSRGRRTSTSGQLPITYALPGRLVLMCLDYRKHSLPGAFWWVLLPFPLSIPIPIPLLSTRGNQEWHEYDFPVFGFLLCFSLFPRWSIPQPRPPEGLCQCVSTLPLPLANLWVPVPVPVLRSWDVVPSWSTFITRVRDMATCIIYCPLCWATLRIHWPVQPKVIGLWKGEWKRREAAALSSIFSHLESVWRKTTAGKV